MNILFGFSLTFGLFSNIYIASTFGISDLVDAYFAAILFPSMIVSLFIDFVGKNFLPIVEKLKEEDKDISVFTYSSIFFTFIFLLPFFSAIIIFGKQIYSLILIGYNQEKIHLIYDIFLIMSPSIIFILINRFYEYIWQHREHYNRVSLASSLQPIGMLVSIFFLQKFYGIYALPIGFLLGHFLVFILYSFNLRLKIQNINFDKNIKALIFNSSILILSGSLSRFRMIFEQVFGSTLEAGSIAAMSFASRITQPLYNGVMRGIRIISFTRASKHKAKGDEIAFNDVFIKSTLGIFLVLSPLTVWIILNTDIIVELLFKRGNANDQDMISLVSLALLGYAPAIIIKSANRNIKGFFYAADKIIYPAVIGPIITLITLLLIFLLKDYGVFGIAISGTIASLIDFIVSMYCIYMLSSGFDLLMILRGSIYYILNAVAVFLIATQIASHLNFNYIFEMLISITIGSMLYMGLNHIMKDRIQLIILKGLLNKLKNI